MARRSSLKGDFQLRKTLRGIHQHLPNELRSAMQEAADMVLEAQRELMPKDTGAAAAALEAYVSSNGLDAQIGLRGKKDNREFFYVKFLERGTKGYSGRKRAGGRNRRSTMKTDGSHFFGMYPDIPARAAHPWLRPSYDMNRDEIITIIRGAVRQTLERAGQGARSGPGN